MCGVVGFAAPDGLDEAAPAVLSKMMSSIQHRGPDDMGSWTDASAGVALGHRRLSVIDLSPDGRQPMVSRSGRYIIVFNGEIYNYRELRARLQSEGVSFRTQSDTEVMLAAFERFGVMDAVRHFSGMFALALYDREEKLLHLVRDRLGEKPLYYGWMGKTLLFGSELKALRAHPCWSGQVDRDSLTLFLRHGYIPAPYSIYQGVRKVRPGTVISLRIGPRAEVIEDVYWSLQSAAETEAGEWRGTDEELLDQLDQLLRQTVRREMVSDVPLGAFLSGGIDSSLVVALMQAQSERPIQTFTIGFDEAEYNEAHWAKAVAAHLNTNHTELYVRSEDALAVVPKLPTLYDEPFADSSQIPTFLVSALARRHVTVSLSGDGGDELFGGYDRYALTHRMWRMLKMVPQGGRQALARGIQAVPPTTWDRVLGSVGIGRGPRQTWTINGDRIHKAARVLYLDTKEALYRDLISHWREPDDITRSGAEPPTLLTTREGWARVGGLLEWMMYVDMGMYLPDDILVKVDRASMGVSLESRAPFLDHQVVEFAWRLPSRARVRGGVGKWALRQLLARYLPNRLIDRPKMGFGVPIDHWLRGPLKEWASGLLDESRLSREGYLDPGPIRQKWVEHQNGSRNWHYLLWDVLMFQAWLEAS